MAFVTIDSEGNVTGIFACPQPQLSEYQEIDDTDSRIASFFTAQSKTQQPTLSDLQKQLTAIQAQIQKLTGQ